MADTAVYRIPDYRNAARADDAITSSSTDPSVLRHMGCLFTTRQCQSYLQTLLSEVDWQYEYLAFGRRFEVPRIQAWYADPDIHYRYANNFLKHRDWIAPLSSIRGEVERVTGHAFNSVLVTWYRDGNDHVTWHADDDAELGDAPVIASLSLGATREFQYRHKQSHEIRRVPLHDGELLLMQSALQRDWDHRVPVEPEVTTPRINLTFRRIYTPDRD